MFYSNDHEPIHVHILKDGCEAKYNVSPVEQVYNHGFKPSELKYIEEILKDNEEMIAEHWNMFFNNAR